MATQVLKYPVSKNYRAYVPFSAKVAHVGFQKGVPTVWALVAYTDETKVRPIYFYPTGEKVADGQMFVGTLVNEDGSFVLHAFEDFLPAALPHP